MPLMRLIADGLLAHAVVVGVWLVAAITFVGLGTWLRIWWRMATSSWRDLSLAFWLGIGACAASLQLWHLARPVNAWAVVALVAFGVAGAWRARTALTGVAAPGNAWIAAFTVCALLWIANRALGPSVFYDTGMYHQPSVAWTNAFAIVPGLGNLHGRLAFNSTALLLAAPFDVGWLDGGAVHFLNSLLIAALTVEAACALVASRREPIPRAFDVFSLAIMPLVISAAFRHDVRSLSTDFAVATMLLAATRVLFDSLAHPVPEWPDRMRKMAAILLLFTAAVTMKLSAVIVAAASVLVVFWSLRPAGDHRVRAWSRLALWSAPSVLLLGGWLVRSAIVSGYPLFPSTAFPLPVDWRMPVEHVVGEAAWIAMSARNLNNNLIYPGLSWLLPWLRGIIVRGDLFVQLTLPALLMAAVGVFAIMTRARAIGPPWNSAWRRAWIPLGVGIVFWLVSAPHPRLAQGVLWSGAGMALAWWAGVRTHDRGRTPARRLAAVVLGVTAAICLKQWAGVALRADPTTRWRETLEAVVTLPDGGVWLAPLPVPELSERTLAGGVRVLVPVDDNGCWNTPVLCTPHPDPSLETRGIGDGTVGLRSPGFRASTGHWAPERWPNQWTPFLAWWRCVRSANSHDAAVERRCLAQVSAASATPPGAGRVRRSGDPNVAGTAALR